ncbi:MAG: hypothetical protein KDD53_01935, partial [Bdellovibrionales bacterium]|nr:hypothetical protein [Bdellovibrionales bacterium]
SAQQRDGERPEKDESLEIEVPDAELCIAFDESGTQFIERYLSDVPQQLELTYGSYGLIPNREMPRLDTYIMEQLGFEPTVAGTQAFREFLQQVADGLVNGADDGQIKAWREKILPAFYCIGLYDGEPDEEIPILGNTTIVFHRLLDRLQSLDHRVTDEGLFRLFPDFDPKHESRMRLVAKNLATLRRMVYGKSAREMMELCIEELLDSGKIQPGHELFDWLSLDRDQLERDDIIHSLVTQLAEGHRPPNTGELAGVSLRQHGRFGTVGAGRWQRICTALYLSLDRLEDRLVSTDFMNAPDAFRRLLIDRGLAIGDILTPAKFFNRMFSLFDTYLTASERAQKEPTEDNEQNIINAAKALDHFLTHQDYNAFLHFRELGKARITTLLDYAKRLDSTIERRGSLIGTEEHAIKTHFDEMLQTACIRQVFPLQGPEKLALEIQRVPYDRTWRYEVNLLWPAESERAKINGISPVIDIHEDALGQAACLIHSSGTPNILQIAYRAGHLSAETREDIVAQMARSFGLLEGAFGARLVVILPQDTGKRGFYHSLAGELLEKRDCDLISGLRSIRPDIVSTATLDFNLLEIRESRLAFLDPGNVSRLRVACGGPGAQSFDYRLAELYLAIAEFDQLVLPTWPQAFRKLETVRSGDPFIERVAQELSREMEILIRDDLSGRATRSDLLNIFRYLGGDSEAPLSESQIVVSALHLLARNKEGQDGGVNDFSAGIRSSIRQLTRVMMLSEMREDIAASGDELRNATSFCRQTLQKISRGNGWARSFEADAKMLLDNIQRGKVAVHTTRPSSSTLPLEIGPEPVGPSGAVGTNQNFLDGKVEITLSYRPKKTRPHAFSVKQTPSTGKPNMLHWDSHCGALLKEKADGYTQKGTTTYAEVAMLSGEWHLCRTCQPIHPGHDFMNWEGYAPRRKGVTS